MKEYNITAENEGQRFDKYLGRILADGGMSFIYKMLRKKNFVLNDKKADGKEILKCGDNIKLYLSDDTFEKFRTKSTELHSLNSDKYDFSSMIIYEDKDIILINKPAGILSQKADKKDITINELIIDYLSAKGEISESSLIEYKPSVINRLDRNTTGIIVAAKSLKAARILSEDLKLRNINKYYQCVVYGIFNMDGLYKGYLTKNRNSNKSLISDSPINDASEYIETEYSILKTVKKDNYSFSYLNVHLITGKSHQIRAHLSYLGFPIVGDPKYGNVKINNELYIKKQLLHAYKIEFPEYDVKYNFHFSGKTFICQPDFGI